jgi:hypothetical protein
MMRQKEMEEEKEEQRKRVQEQRETARKYVFMKFHSF